MSIISVSDEITLVVQKNNEYIDFEEYEKNKD